MSTPRAQRIGYGRVSTTDQNLESQQDSLTAAKVDRLYIEKITGTKAHRPELDKALDVLRAGDTLVITRLDRLGRSTKDLLNIAAQLETTGVQLEVTEQNIDTSTPEGKLFFTMVAAFAEFEHSMMRARTMDGLAAARARGRSGGRKAKLSPAAIGQAQAMYASREHTVQEIADILGVSRPTVYRAISTPAGR